MWRIVTLSVALLVLVGCGSKRPAAGSVEGSITYKGQPVNGAGLELHSATGKGEFLIPVSQEGTFRTSDVPPGEYKIVVHGAVGSSGPPTTGMTAEEVAKVKEKIEKMKTPATIPFPHKYKSQKTTDLKCTISEGKQELKLELKD
jgi:hypothetical protein